MIHIIFPNSTWGNRLPASVNEDAIQVRGKALLKLIAEPAPTDVAADAGATNDANPDAGTTDAAADTGATNDATNPDAAPTP